jgi:hypothetical protein
MEDTAMPEPLRRAIHRLVSEAVQHCPDVLSYSEPFAAHESSAALPPRPPPTAPSETVLRGTAGLAFLGAAGLLVLLRWQHGRPPPTP